MRIHVPFYFSIVRARLVKKIKKKVDGLSHSKLVELIYN